MWKYIKDIIILLFRYTNSKEKLSPESITKMGHFLLTRKIMNLKPWNVHRVYIVLFYIQYIYHIFKQKMLTFLVMYIRPNTESFDLNKWFIISLSLKTIYNYHQWTIMYSPRNEGFSTPTLGTFKISSEFESTS